MLDMKLAPYDPIAETQIISSILADNDVLIDLEISIDDFYSQNLRRIFTAIKQLQSENREIDAMTIHDVDSTLEVSMILDVANQLYWGSLKESIAIVKEKSILRKIIIRARRIHNLAMDQAPVDDLVREIGKLQSSLQTESWTQQDFIDVLCKVYDTLWSSSEMVCSTWFKWLDAVVWWIKRWQLIIIAGRASMGKTVFWLNMALDNALVSKKKVMFFSLEMTNQEIAKRVLSKKSSVPLWLLDDKLNDQQEAKLKKGMRDIALNDDISFVLEDRLFSLDKIKQSIQKHKFKYWLDVVYIDYLQLMRHTRQNNRNLEIGSITIALKELAKDLDIGIVLLSQLSRDVEKRNIKHPILSDLRDSGSIEQDADIVIMLYREDYYDKEDESIRNILTAFVRKNRNWPTDDVNLKINAACMDIYDL